MSDPLACSKHTGKNISKEKPSLENCFSKQCITVSRSSEWCGLEGTFRITGEHFSLEQVSQSPLQPNLDQRVLCVHLMIRDQYPISLFTVIPKTQLAQWHATSRSTQHEHGVTWNWFCWLQRSKLIIIILFFLNRKGPPQTQTREQSAAHSTASTSILLI